jgi:16S rRNA (guanine527-N7)-methyltransferase
VKQSEKNLSTYEKLYVLQEEYNRHTNITRINCKEDYYLKHIADSLAVLPFLNKEDSIIDVGTGAGYPGIPLAIELPQTKIILNDSIQKKTNYLSQVVQALRLTNASVLRGRAEDLAKLPEHKNNYSAAIARAVADTATLLVYLSPLVRSKGRIYIMKGKTIDEELAAAKKIEAKYQVALEAVREYQVENLERKLLIYKKN